MFDFLNSFFGYVWTFFNGIFGWLGKQIWNGIEWLDDALSSLFDWLGRQIWNGIDWIGRVISSFFDALTNFLYWLIKPILDLIDGILYLFQQIFQIIVLIIQLIASIFQLIVAIGTGFINTITGLTQYSGNTGYYNIPSGYSGGFHGVADFLSNTGFNTVALILAVFVWLITAYIIVKIISSNK